MVLVRKPPKWLMSVGVPFEPTWKELTIPPTRQKEASTTRKNLAEARILEDVLHLMALSSVPHWKDLNSLRVLTTNRALPRVSSPTQR